MTAAGRRELVPGGPFLSWDEARRAATGMRRLREAQDLTQTDLGERLGTSQGWVCVRETCSVRMRRGNAEVVARALGTDLAGLLEAGAS